MCKLKISIKPGRWKHTWVNYITLMLYLGPISANGNGKLCVKKMGKKFLKVAKTTKNTENKMSQEKNKYQGKINKVLIYDCW